MSGGATRQVLSWSCFGVIVVSAHVLAATWMVQRSVAALPNLPEAHFIELAPAPAMAEPAVEAAPEPQPEPEPQPMAEPELPDLQPLPPPDFPEIALPELAEAPPDAALLNSARPPRRPERRETPEPVQQAKPEPKKEQPRKTEPRREAQAGKASQAATGSSTARQAASPKAVANWQGQVQARVARHMQRSRISGVRGRLNVTLRVEVAANGSARGTLVSQSGDTRIDSALARQAGRMPRLPAPPGGRQVALTVPVLVTVR